MTPARLETADIAAVGGLGETKEYAAMINRRCSPSTLSAVRVGSAVSLSRRAGYERWPTLETALVL
jgi:hypothetical protein